MATADDSEFCAVDFLSLLDEVSDDAVRQFVYGEASVESPQPHLDGMGTDGDILSVCDSTTHNENFPAIHSDSDADDLNFTLMTDDTVSSAQKTEQFVAAKKPRKSRAHKKNGKATSGTATTWQTTASDSHSALTAPSASSPHDGHVSQDARRRVPGVRHRFQFTKQQTQQLKAAFEKTPYPGRLPMMELSQQLQTPVSRLRVWFQNQRFRRRHGLGQSGDDLTQHDEADTVEGDNPVSPTLPAVSDASTSNNVRSDGSTETNATETKPHTTASTTSQSVCETAAPSTTTSIATTTSVTTSIGRDPILSSVNVLPSLNDVRQPRCSERRKEKVGGAFSERTRVQSRQINSTMSNGHTRAKSCQINSTMSNGHTRAKSCQINSNMSNGHTRAKSHQTNSSMSSGSTRAKSHQIDTISQTEGTWNFAPALSLPMVPLSAIAHPYPYTCTLSLWPSYAVPVVPSLALIDAVGSSCPVSLSSTHTVFPPQSVNLDRTSSPPSQSVNERNSPSTPQQSHYRYILPRLDDQALPQYQPILPKPQSSSAGNLTLRTGNLISQTPRPGDQIMPQAYTNSEDSSYRTQEALVCGQKDSELCDRTLVCSQTPRPGGQIMPLDYPNSQNSSYRTKQSLACVQKDSGLCDRTLVCSLPQSVDVAEGGTSCSTAYPNAENSLYGTQHAVTCSQKDSELCDRTLLCSLPQSVDVEEGGTSCSTAYPMAENGLYRPQQTLACGQKNSELCDDTLVCSLPQSGDVAEDGTSCSAVPSGMESMDCMNSGVNSNSSSLSDKAENNTLPAVSHQWPSQPHTGWSGPHSTWSNSTWSNVPNTTWSAGPTPMWSNLPNSTWSNLPNSTSTWSNLPDSTWSAGPTPTWSNHNSGWSSLPVNQCWSCPSTGPCQSLCCSSLYPDQNTAPTFCPGFSPHAAEQACSTACVQGPYDFVCSCDALHCHSERL